MPIDDVCIALRKSQHQLRPVPERQVELPWLWFELNHPVSDINPHLIYQGKLKITFLLHLVYKKYHSAKIYFTQM